MIEAFDSWKDLDLITFRELQRQRGLEPYERLTEPDRRDRALANRIMEDGWALGRFPRIQVTPPVPWNEIAASNRSWEFHLHCWDFLGPALCVLDEESDDRLVAFLVSVAVDWANSHPSLDVESRMAWYDMAVGVRAYRLARILELASRSQVVDDAAVETLLQSIQLHQVAFTQEGIFKPHSNHGLYVAAGQKAMSRRLALLPGMDEQSSQSDERLRLMIATQFTAEGVHREHSPDYHRMILSTMRNLGQANLLPSDTSVDLETIEEALAWFVLPDGSLAMFGDTPLRTLPGAASYGSPILQYAASAGQRGRPPEENWRAFSESGYAVYRSGWPAGDDDPEDWTYLALNAAFHSRTHKHADDLSFVWYDRGSHILVDPGRYGYLEPTNPDSDLGLKGFYYADPNRVYVEETRAHNAVEIDGQSYQRRGVSPYGSAIRRTGEQQGIFYTEAHAEHLTLDRSYRIQHTRLVMLRPREWLIVHDRLWDPRNRPHQFRQWFQFAPHVAVKADDFGWSMTGPDGWRLWGVPLLEGTRSAVMRGVSEPELQGWVSSRDHEIEPTSSTCLNAAGESVSIATLFGFSNLPPIPRASVSSDSYLALRWAADVEWALMIEMSADEEIDLNVVIGER